MKTYGDELSAATGGKHFVIDTSRNGQGSNGEWCNALGRSVGELPRMIHSSKLDAYLWIKYPGESDGTCNGGPSAGQWWADYALNLIAKAGL
jgi:endoglucanase